MSDYHEWIGREERRSDTVDNGHLARWLAAFDRDAPAGGAVPQAFHWCLCLPDAPTSALDVDGHPKRDESPGSFLPPVDLPRRMWASSKVQFHAPLSAGDGVTRVSRVASIKAKQGGSGSLVFVDVAHETHGPAGLAVSETQSIVYREASPAGSVPVPASPGDGKFDAGGWMAHRLITPREPLLFRFSALTFNSHRIHYDLPYATGEEGYRGLVVHGPLTATLLLDLAAREFGDNALKSFAFRGNSPGICGEELHLVLRCDGDGVELGAFAADGRNVMSATATL
jgi:3-methylfumaryl-CoA hydratase